MEEIQLKLDDNGRGAFVMEKGGEQLALMEIVIRNKILTVYHTEVIDKLKGTGVASKLLTTMVNYAKAYQLEVIPLCEFVSVQFKRHPDHYNDVWKQN